jgi:uncharacterized 2Fe-2S/4Fe-4S cluster protein (DUF4445 family)
MTHLKKINLKILPHKKEIKVVRGYNLRQAIVDCGIDIGSSCGGVGTCGRCKVKIISGNIESKKSKFISKKEKDEGYVLSCLSKVLGDAVISVPERKKEKAKIDRGRFDSKEKKSYVGINEEELASVEIKPWIIKKKIKVEIPTLSYNTNDLFRLRKSIKKEFMVENVDIPIEAIKKFPYQLRENNWEVTATLDKNKQRLLNIQPPGSGVRCLGLALDIGTTSLVMYLVDLGTSEIIGSLSEYNPQIKYGEDIINRIVYSQKKGGLQKLQGTLMDAVNNMILRFISNYNVNEQDIVAMMVAGNATMMHIFYGVPPKFIREEPYITIANKFPEIKAETLNLKNIKNAMIYNIEGVASYLGGDITSGVVATNIAKREKVTLFLDLGTNGELVIGNNEWIMGCSCSAGPAFEGGGVKCGIRAVDGAIEKVVIDQKTYKCAYDVIGGKLPMGICGSGLIDIIGELYLKGVIDRKGKFNKDIGNRYLQCVDKDCVYIIERKENTKTGDDIYISETDINNLVRAKAAVYSGIRTLLDEIGLTVNDIDKIYIAGGLGKNINIKNSIIIGMLPDVDINKYSFLGNTAVAGAYLSLLSEDMYKQTSEIANKITYIELSMNMKFMDRYVAGLFLPYTDLKDFPTVESIFYSQKKERPMIKNE